MEGQLNMSELYVLIKRGLYWRPDAAGYTGLLREAGLYTREDWESRGYPNSEVSVMLYDRADQFSPSCCRDVQMKELGRKEALNSSASNSASASGQGGSSLGSLTLTGLMYEGKMVDAREALDTLRIIEDKIDRFEKANGEIRRLSGKKLSAKRKKDNMLLNIQALARSALRRDEK